MGDLRIQMPNAGWRPRRHQVPFLEAVDTGGYRRALLLFHRRAGKDSAVLNWIANRQVQEPLSALYLLPEFKQAKRVLMRELNEQGMTHVEQAYPAQLLKGDPNKTEGVLTLWNGSILQLGGFDRIDSYVGMGPRIVVMSEFAVSKHAERALQLLMPILLRNKGWLILPYTPRGKGHGYKQYLAAQASPDWFCEKLTVDDTGLIPVEAIKSEIDAGTIDEDYARQEFWCSFEAPNTGSYYGRAMERLEQVGQVTDVAWEPTMPVYTGWDIGFDDATAIWFAQPYKTGWINLIDYYEFDGEGLAHYLEVLNERKRLGWSFEPNGQIGPHDFGATDYSTGETRVQAAQKLGWRINVLPAQAIADQHDAVRRVLPKCRFDKAKCAKGIERLRSYRKRWSEQLQQFTGPLHDEASHGASAFATLVMGLRRAGFQTASSARVAEIQARDERPFAQAGVVVARTDWSAFTGADEERREERPRPFDPFEGIG